ncbi:metal ABC transporter solute-binding protein, Zn/Mn family [Halobacteriaceae archaeon SHR40]|uniref:metal ABC transporter solute-binding protein, Zn/Mn family n=1 Tax=Halovenus amylolytica TaxID=2500550 RepID=UPI000FE2F87F
MNPTRRDVLRAGAGLAAAGSLAGCLDAVGLGAEETDADGYAMFFALHDWAEQVGGDEMHFANPVSTGKMGHGWSPNADITPEVASTGMFIYLDTPDFEWARRVANNLERDHDDVVVVDLLDGMDQYLLSATDDGHDHEGEDDHAEENHDDNGSEETHESEAEHDGEDEQRDEFHDPHIWIDPVAVQEMVDRLAEEFATVDPDNADTYEQNAVAYNDKIQGVHEEFGRVVDTAELDVAILAGHDSYSYVEQRYGFDLKTPTGISPDARASRDDIINLIETIEENEIDTILYDPFESSSPGDDFPQIVDSILEESSAEHAEPLTPVSGTTDQWEENGWGWIEQMEQVNMDSLDAALNPS